MTQFIGRQIRSKHTYQKGIILGINKDHIIVTFTEEYVPLPLKFDVFLKNCMCDDEVREYLEKQRQIQSERSSI